MNCVNPSLWKPEGQSYRSDDGTRLPDFYDVPDHSLGAKRNRAETVVRAMLDQFLSQDPDLRPGELKRISEQDVDVAPIINQFQQSRKTNT